MFFVVQENNIIVTFLLIWNFVVIFVW